MAHFLTGLGLITRLDLVKVSKCFIDLVSNLVLAACENYTTLSLKETI